MSKNDEPKRNIFSPSKQNYDIYDRLARLCPKGWYMTIPKEDLEGLIPSGLLVKAVNVLIMCTDVSGSTVFLANLNRKDKDDTVIDEHPFIAAIDTSGSFVYAGIVHHGNWENRTTPAPKEIQNLISASCILLQEMPTNGSGLIADLKIKSQLDALELSLSCLRTSKEKGFFSQI